MPLFDVAVPIRSYNFVGGKRRHQHECRNVRDALRWSLTTLRAVLQEIPALFAIALPARIGTSLEYAAPDLAPFYPLQDRRLTVVCRADHAAVYCALTDDRSHGSFWAAFASSNDPADAGVVFDSHDRASTDDHRAAQSGHAQHGCARRHASSRVVFTTARHIRARLHDLTAPPANRSAYLDLLPRHTRQLVVDAASDARRDSITI